VLQSRFLGVIDIPACVEFMGKERKVLKPPEFKRMLPRFYIASTDEVGA
jgi:hypothetical protein